MSTGQSSNSYRAQLGEPRPTSAPDLLRGTKIRDYVVERFIASGGFGSVYRVRDAEHNRVLALKILHPELCNLGDAFVRFLREAQVLDRIRHPNIIEVYDSGSLPDGRAFVVTEFLSGIDLEEHIESSGALSVASTIEVLEPICDALAHAHAQSVIHRDIKASNVFLCDIDSDGKRRIVLLDFGLAKVIEQGGIDLTASRMTLGTPSCMSPEQIRGDKVDARADIYALGALSFHMLTGRPPFAGKSQTVMQYMHLHGQRPRPSSLAKVSVAIDEVIGRAMAPDRANRYGTAEEFLSALRDADSALKPNRRARRAKQTQRALGVYVDVRVSSEEDDDDVLDAIDGVLDAAEERLTRAGLQVGLEGSSSTLYVRVLADDDKQALRERRETALAVADLRRILNERLNATPAIHVNLCLHVDGALVTEERVTGGDLLHLTRWAPEGQLDGVVGSPGAFDGLDVEVEPVAGSSLVRLVIPKEANGSLVDLFESPEGRQRLMHTQMLAQLGRQVAGIVHDLRSPLTVIQGNLDLALQALEDERQLSDDHRKGLEDAFAAAQQLAMTVASILRASAIKSYGKDRRELSVSDLIASAIRLSRSETRKKADINVVHADDSYIMGSPGRLTQVFVNLLVNAAQAIEDYGTISIHTANTDRGVVEIAIRDTGVGISEAVQQRIFEPFFTTKEMDQGTGLGLALVREILEEHGGSIRLDSASGQGTCFTVELPSARR